MFQLADKELNESAARIRKQIQLVENDKRYSQEYIEEFKAARRKDLAAVVRMAREHAEAKADQLRRRAKERYLDDDSFDNKEAGLFRDYAAAAEVDALVKLATDSTLNTAKVLILGGELRRRGRDTEANILCATHELSAEPWTQTEEWEQADRLLDNFRGADATRRALASAGFPISEELYVMTTEGVAKPIDAILL